MQVVNWSGGLQTSEYPQCWQSGNDAICNALDYLHLREVSVVVSAGNGETDLFFNDTPQFPGLHTAVLAVAAGEKRGIVAPQECLTTSTAWCRWKSVSTPSIGWNNGTNAPGINGIFAPGRLIVSPVTLGTINDLDVPANYGLNSIYRCADNDYDESGQLDDGVGSCTGTSMAAPHISALAGIVRSINPLLRSVDGITSVRSLIQLSGDAVSPNAHWGHGMADAYQAVQIALATNPRRLTPLFSYYSPGREDSFYTTIPQMARAAVAGTLQPMRDSDCAASAPTTCKYYNNMGNGIAIYNLLPDPSPDPSTIENSPVAAAWIFTTPQNPIDPNLPLVPLYRFSWKCGDDTPFSPYICDTDINPTPNLTHTSHAYSADPVNGVEYFNWLGYKLDGIEGYIFPRTMAQPIGTVKLMRLYNPYRDDMAIFPASQLATYSGWGYTESIGNTDWIGYVYPNSNGQLPQILPMNVALVSSGGVVTASSVYSANYPANAVNDGDHIGMNWGAGGGWNDATIGQYPDWIQIAFNGTQIINKVVIYTVQDNFSSPVESTDTQTFSQYGIVDFTVQGWNGSTWVTLATVAGNNLVKRTVNFNPFTTDRIRINVTSALAGYSRIVEVEAWTAN